MASEKVHGDLSLYPEYAEGYVTFTHWNGRWQAHEQKRLLSELAELDKPKER